MTYAATAAWLRPRLWMAWPVGAFVWLAWLTSLALGGWTKDAEGTPIGVDHLAFYSAAHLIREGQTERMYDYGFLVEYQRSRIGHDRPILVGYRNPPFYALLYDPTAGLPFVASFLIWTAVGLAVLALAIRLLKPERYGRTLLLALTFYPVFATVSFGQNTLLSLGVFAAVFRLLEDRRPFLAGLVAGLLWFKPQLLIGLFIWWALAPRQHFRCWLGVATTGLVLAAVCWLVLPEASWAFVESLEKNVGYGGENGWNKQSPRAFWTLLLPQAPAAITWSLTLVCAGSGIAGAVWVARRSGAPLAVMFPVAVFLTLWVSPHTLIYEWALLVPAAIVLWTRLPERRDAWLSLFVPAWLVLTVTTVLAKVQIEGFAGFPALPAVVQLGVPAMATIGVLAFRELATTRPGHSATPPGHPVTSAGPLA